MKVPNAQVIINFKLEFSEITIYFILFQFLIMVTYYIAQFFIALTIVDSADDKKKSQFSQSNFKGNGVTYTEQKIK